MEGRQWTAVPVFIAAAISMVAVATMVILGTAPTLLLADTSAAKNSSSSQAGNTNVISIKNPDYGLKNNNATQISSTSIDSSTRL